MPASRPALPLAVLLALAGCRFAPDLSAYPTCGDGGGCPAGTVCLASEGVCVACAPGEAGCLGPDAGTGVGEPDAGALPDGGPLRFATEDLPPAKEGELYVQTLTAAGGRAPYTFSLASGGLPEGLTLTSLGTLAGQPAAAGSASFAVQVTDATSQVAARGFVLAVDPASGEALKIDTSALPEGALEATYSAQLLATGGTAPYQWSVSSGALPSGLAMSQAGSVYGVPAAAGETTLQVSVRDASSPAQTALHTFSLRIAPAQGEVLALQTSAVPDGAAGAYYLAQLEASGGEVPYTFGLASGSSLPPGLALSSAGAISGTPTSAGTASFLVQVVDASSPAQLSSRALSLSVAGGSAAPLSIATAALPEGTVQVAYSAALSASGGTPPVTFALTSGSALPAGLTLSSAGTVGGTPTAAGTYSLSITAQDSSSPTQTATHGYVLTIGTGTATVPLSVATAALPSGTAGVAYAQTLAATGGAMPYAWSLASGALPPGLSLSTLGAIAGTATAAGAFSFTAKVTDSGEPAQVASRSFTLDVIAADLAIDTTDLPNATAGAFYNAQISASGGLQPYSFAITSATSLPKGLSLCASGSCAGLVSGTPQGRGKSTFDVQVTDSSPTLKTAMRTLSIEIN